MGMTRLAILGLLGVLIAGCSSSHPSARAPSPSTTIPSITTSPSTPKEAATALGQRMLGEAVLPSGTHPLKGLAPAVLRGPSSIPGMDNLVFAHRLLTVNEAPHAVWQWLQAHVPGGFTKTETSSGTNRGIPTWGVEDDLSVAPQNISTAELQLAIAGNASGQAVMRVDTVVGWTEPRPRAEFVRTNERTVIVTVIHSGFGLPAGGTIGKRVVTSDPKLVQPIVRTFDRLRIYPPGGVTECGALSAHPVVYRVAFAASPTSTPEVVATVGRCGSVQVIVGGRDAPGLDDLPAQAFATSAAHLLGLSQPHFG
jgi:hypothetical protein